MGRHAAVVPTDQQLADINFAGTVLGPFFSCDPALSQDKLQPSAQALLDLDLPAAAQAWPFVEGDAATESLSLMQQGLAEGLDSEPLPSEYRRLFVGPAAKVAAPWGSVYTDKDMVVFGESTLDLKDWLRCKGIVVARSGSDEPEDHIGTLLSLMGWLAQNKPELVCEFLQYHLLTWSGHFLDIVASETNHPFYRGLACLTDSTLCGIQRALALEVELPRFYR